MQYKLPFLIEPQPPTRQSPAHTHHVILGGAVVPYRLRRSARRTIGLTIDEQGLHAAAPYWVGLAEIEAFMHEKEAWLLKHLRSWRAHRPRFVWQPGARLPYLGDELTLECDRENDAGVRRSGRWLQVGAIATLQPERLRTAVLAWLKREAITLYAQRIAQLAARFDLTAPEIALSNARTQWGSCTRGRDGSARILMNWKLVHFELPLIDYVAAHELAHLRHMNHSAAFWNEVARVYPRYQNARRALRERGHLIPEL